MSAVSDRTAATAARVERFIRDIECERDPRRERHGPTDALEMSPLGGRLIAAAARDWGVGG